MSSRESSACYPQSTFYPLSDDLSTQGHRITMTDFRLCSTCLSYSQASLCHYTQQLISDQLELTFALLRYSLGGDRPSQTTHFTGSDIKYRQLLQNSSVVFHFCLEFKLTSKSFKLPHILHMSFILALQSCSKGSQGLSVQLLELRIFTENSISLSQCWRQRRSRYTIHAGRNLPVKEFRYLWTVMVTAAVYWGFNSQLSLILLTFQHRAGVRPYTSSYEFAESCVFSKQSLLPIMCHLCRYSLFRSYRAILPSSFNIVLSIALVHLYQFTSVGLGYGLS